MVLLNANSILKAEDLPHEIIKVPEWGGEIRIGTMAGPARNAYEMSLPKPDKNGKSTIEVGIPFMARIISLCAQDEKGNEIFTAKHVEKLSKKNPYVIRRVFDVCDKLNLITDGMTKKEVGKS